MRKLTFFIACVFLLLATLTRIKECRDTIVLVKRQRFLDPNLNYERTSKRIDRLIQILNKGSSKVKEEIIRDEMSDILKEITRLFAIVDNHTDKRPSYWYTREG